MSTLSFFHTLANKAMDVLTDDIEPALLTLWKNFSHDAVARLMPLATTSVTQVEGALIASAASGNWTEFGSAVGAAIADAGNKAVGIIQGVAVNDVVTAVNAAIAGHAGIQAAVVAVATPAAIAA